MFSLTHRDLVKKTFFAKTRHKILQKNQPRNVTQKRVTANCLTTLPGFGFFLEVVDRLADVPFCAKSPSGKQWG